RLRGRGGQVPDATFRLDGRVRRVGECQVGGTLVFGSAGRVRGGTYERVAKADSSPDLEQLCRLRRCGVDKSEAEPLRRAPEARRIASWVRGGQQHQSLRRSRQRAHASDVVLFNVARQCARLRDTEATGKLCGTHPSWEFEQPEWVPACLGHNSVANVV